MDKEELSLFYADVNMTGRHVFPDGTDPLNTGKLGREFLGEKMSPRLKQGTESVGKRYKSTTRFQDIKGGVENIVLERV